MVSPVSRLKKQVRCHDSAQNGSDSILVVGEKAYCKHCAVREKPARNWSSDTLRAISRTAQLPRKLYRGEPFNDAAELSEARRRLCFSTSS